MIWKFRLWAPIAMLALLPTGAAAQNAAAEFHTRFLQDTDPVHRAESMHKLGAAEFDEITKDFDAAKFPAALALLREYRDEIDACGKGLDARNVDAEKHPKGYKQLEMSVRESLRRLDRLIVSLTADEQAPFVEVRQNLEAQNRHLLHELFPNRPSDENTQPD
ncbi:MAG TPA: hypothetical protein VG322_00785 [Candidatus Acidoferrales bacterium]|nr:hypothetical protein [Candidatus Acidoferrales bacterium]